MVVQDLPAVAMDHRIIDVRKQVDDGKPAPRDLDVCKLLAVHRCGKDLRYDIDLGDTAVEVCEHFTGRNTEYPEVAKTTKGQLAYSLMIGGDLGDLQYDGVIWQCLSLDDIGYHARRFSVPAIGVGLIADPQRRAVSFKQHTSLVWLLALLAGLFALDPIRAIRGHMELNGGSLDSRKQCPGPFLHMQSVRRAAAAEIRMDTREHSERQLAEAGLIIEGIP